MEGRRSKAARYLLNSRNLFFNNKSLSMALGNVKRAMKMLDKDEISVDIHGWYVFLLILKEEQEVPVFYDEFFKNSDSFFFLHILLTFRKKGVSAMICEISNRDKREPKRVKGFFSDYMAAYMSAKCLYDSGDIESAFAILSKTLKSIEGFGGVMFSNLKALCLSSLGKYYEKKNKPNITAQVMKKAFELVEKSPLYFISANVYLNIASFYASNFGIRSSSKVLDKALEISNLYISEKLLIPILRQLQYNCLYKGEVKEFRKHLRYSRTLCEKLNDRYGYAWTYILEGDFYIYDKDAEKALDCFKLARELSEEKDLVSTSHRHSMLCLFYNNRWNEADEMIREFNMDHAEFGFKKVVELYLAKGPEDIRTAFDDFLTSTKTWREEVALAFSKKLSDNLPEIYEEYLKSLIDRHQKDDELLGLASVYEAAAKHYKNVGLKDMEIKMLRKSIELYRKTGFGKAARDLANTFRFDPENYQKMCDEMENLVARHGEYGLIKEFKAFKELQIQNMIEQDAMKEIMDFLSSMNTQNDLYNVLRDILKWLVSYVPAKEAHIVIKRDGNTVLESYEITGDKKLEINKDMQIYERQAVISNDGFEVKYDYYIDDNHSLRLYLSNEDISIPKEEFEKFSIILSDIEPVLRLLLRNAIYYKSSIYDPLTGLFTRWYYEDRFSEELEKSRRYRLPLSYVICDIDHFKKVNDSYGHVIGDEVLKELGRIFKESTRQFDILARYGGEEFALVLPNTSSSQAYRVAEKIRKTIESMDVFPFNVTMSFGVTGTDVEDYENTLAMVSAADRSLYVAKNRGRNTTVISHPFMENVPHSSFQ